MTLDKNSLILSLLRDSPQFDSELAQSGSISSATLQARLEILQDQGLVSLVDTVAPGAGDTATPPRRQYTLTTKVRARLFNEAALEINADANARRFAPRRR
jgi:DNA-binding HxlR family transcriptional regulator